MTGDKTCKWPDCDRAVGDAPASVCWRHMYEAEWALTRRISAECAAERAGLLERVARLRESLAEIVRCLEDGTLAWSDGIRDEHVAVEVAARSAIVRADHAADNARDEVQRLIAKASEVPGMSATIDELRARVAKLESMTALDGRALT